MPSKRPKKQPARFSLQPDLHAHVAALLEDETNLSFTFHAHDDPASAIRDRNTLVMGRFACANRACSNTGWSSKKIALHIRLYAGARYNARVFHQGCLACRWVAAPALDEEAYAQRIVYWLKKWSGVEVERPPVGSGERNKGPHLSELCEGCKSGHCRESMI